MNLLSSLLLCTVELTLPIGEVKTIPVFQERAYPGRVVAIQRVDVIPQVSGEILEVLFENGQIVKEGDVLYKLDPVKYEAAVKNAESKVVECRANVNYAELSYERHKKLVNTRAVSLDAVDNAFLTGSTACNAGFQLCDASLFCFFLYCRHISFTAYYDYLRNALAFLESLHGNTDNLALSERQEYLVDSAHTC